VTAVALALLGSRSAVADENGAPPAVETLTARAVERPPVIDGVLTPQEWPDDPASTARLDRADQNLPDRRDRWRGPADASAVVRVAADAEALYLGVTFVDDVVFHPGEPWWGGDSLEVFLNTDPSGAEPAEAYTAHDRQVFLMPANPNLRWGVAFHGRAARFDDGGLVGVRTASAPQADGSVTLEARVPLSNFPGLEGGDARRLGFALALNDVDRLVPGADPAAGTAAEPATYLSWNRGFELWRRPRHFGRLLLPARPRPAAAAPAPEPTGSAELWVAAVAGLLLIAFFVGPGSKRLAAWGPRGKTALLVLDALLAGFLATSASCADGRARGAARERLEAAAREANVVAYEAAEVGALDPRDPAARARTLLRLLGGASVPAIPPVAAQAYVPLGLAAREAGEAGPLAYRVPLASGADEDWPLAAPTPARALRVRLAPVPDAGGARRAPAGRVRLATLEATRADGTSEDLPVEADLSEAGERAVRLPLGESATLARLRWRGAEGAPAVVLSSVEALRDDGVETPLALPGRTLDGVPVLARPGTAPGGPDFLGWTLAPGEARTAEVPALAGADRLWLVVAAERAFPATRHGIPVARATLAYASGEPTTTTLENGEDVDDGRLDKAIKHPADMRSRVAWRWVDESGVPHHHDVLAVPVDWGRRPVSLRVENLGGPVSEQGTGRFTLLAATLTRRATDPAGGRLAVDAGGEGGRDAVRLVDPRPFEGVLAIPARETVSLSASLGRDDRKATVTLATPLPEEVRARADRTETALLTCLVLAAFLLVLLAVDAFQSIPRLRPRLVLGVLVAALLPVAVTIVLADRRNASRLEAEREGRVRGWLLLARAALVDGERQEAQVGAQGLLQVVSSMREGGDATRLREAVRVYRRTGIVGGASAAVVVKGRDLGTLSIEPEARGARVDGAAFLADATDAPGLYASPWDGLLLVATARTVVPEDWRKVVLGVRVDDDFVAGRLAPALADREAEIAVLTRSGEPAGVAGPGGAALARGLVAALPALRAGGGGRDTVVISKLRTTEGPRLAMLTPLESAETPDAPAAWLAVAVPRRALDAEVLRLREELLGLGIAAALLVACVAAMLARRIAGPVRALVEATDDVRRGDFDAPVPAPSPDEVGDLALAFDRMRRGLKHRLGDLDLLRRSQEAVSASLDLPGTADAGLRCFRERWPAEAGLLLVALAPTGPVQVRAEWGRDDPVSDAPIVPAPGGWMALALAGTEPVVVTDAATDPRVRAETAAIGRLLAGRNAWIAVPLRAGAEPQGLVVLAWGGAAALPTAEERALLTPLAGVVALAVHNARLHRLAALDESTGLPGATAFESALRRDVDAALEGGPAAVVLRIGLDGFERTARQRGLEPARALRRAMADALRAAALGRVQAGRLAEDEFAVRAPGATRDEAARLAQAIRERLSAVEVRPEDGGEPVRSGVSVGIARCPDDARSFEFLLDGAARAMRAARRDGGDRVEDVARVDAGLVSAPPFEDGAVFRTERMVRVLETARRAARTDSTVLLTGETGVGKEVIADLLHRRSRRADRPFVKVNTAAFPEALLESELFGHEKGAYTGADRRREGRFELADGGTLFLDEVGEMSREAQVRLLRVLADGTYTRLGGQKPLRADVRVVAATNRDLERAVAEGAFREDLYYRLNVLRIEIPPLRERREEIPALVSHFLAEARRRIGRGPSRLSPQAMDVLYRHPWPGNLRELKNVIERAAVLCEGDVAGPEHLRLDPPRGTGAPATSPVAAPLDGLNERQRALLAHLATHGRCTNRRYIELTSASARTGLRDLRDLMARGLIVREGKRRGAVYRLP
jgi:diguanylate cyclase (GGDEF)-like protein